MRIAVCGVGYVGLPLAVACARAGHTVTGYDISEKRIAELSVGRDSTREVPDAALEAANVSFTTDPTAFRDAKIIMVAVPTPVDDKNKPDLSMVESATRTVGKNLTKGTIVVYEATVYPGVTEDLCGPMLEQESNLVRGKDFFLGYSPERINPGDREHTIEKIVKVVAGEDEKTTDKLCELYGSVVKAGIHRAPSIKVAEMAKAIENAQRDLNIAFINEIAILSNALGIETKDVLAAAGTKWNFLPFKPGLVGGHCIGVDPYYLVEMARMLGIKTQVITAGRALNDSMSKFVATSVIESLGAKAKSARVLVLGLTFKEDIPDTRNSKSEDVLNHLKAGGAKPEVHDPFVTADIIASHGFVEGHLESGPYDAIVLLVPHKEYLKIPLDTLIAATKDGGLIYDLKSILDKKTIEQAGRIYQAL